MIDVRNLPPISVGSNTPRWVDVDIIKPDGTRNSTRWDMDAAVNQALANQPRPFQVPPSALQDVGEGLNLLATGATAGAVMGGMMYGGMTLAPALLPYIEPLAYSGAVSGAQFFESPTGQFLYGYASSQLGTTGMPASNPYQFLGGQVNQIYDYINRDDGRSHVPQE